MIRKLAYPAWMLASIGVALACRDVAWCIVAGVLGLGAQLGAARGWRSAAGRIAVANLLTLLRLALVAGLPGLLSSLPRALFIALVVALLVLDGVDGYVARARGETSAFGATLDMETDALTVMVLGFLLWEGGAIGAWVIVAGLWRYVYAFAVALAPSLGDCPPSRLYRWVFCLLVLSFAGAFVPSAALAQAFAALGTILVSLSFLHSLARSRAVRDAIGWDRP